jgi:hypothetical protein
MRRISLLALLAFIAIFTIGCSAPTQPTITFFADGHTTTAVPLSHCDALLRSCEKNNGVEANLKVRPGKSVQISVPSEIADTPWVVNVQYSNARGELQPVQQQVFTPGKSYAYTAKPPTSTDQLQVVEVQQLGAAMITDAAGNPTFDDEGRPEYEVRARAVWSLQIQPA